MEFEATYVVPRDRLRAVMRLYERRLPDGIRLNLLQSRVYLETPCQELYRSSRSVCLIIDRAEGQCLLHKYDAEMLDGYVSRREAKIPLMNQPAIAQQVAGICGSLGLAAVAQPILILKAARKYIVLQTTPQPVMISFDSVKAFSTSHAPLLSFWSIELECNGEAVHDRFLDELSLLRDSFAGEATQIPSKYRYVLEHCPGQLH